MIDEKPAVILSSVADPDRRKMLTLMASSMEPPDRALLPIDETVAIGLVLLGTVCLLLLAI